MTTRHRVDVLAAALVVGAVADPGALGEDAAAIGVLRFWLCAADRFGLLIAHLESSVFGGRLLRAFPVWVKVRLVLLLFQISSEI